MISVVEWPDDETASERGELWTMAGGSGYASKPRPGGDLQDDAFRARATRIVSCLITTDKHRSPCVSVWVEPTAENGLESNESPEWVDKVTTWPGTASAEDSAA